eukprot:9098807-Pyramimonas_sp.AAC.1
MPTSVADLKALQGKIKRDPAGYKEEFLLQQRHYRALLVRMSRQMPTSQGRELLELLSGRVGCFGKRRHHESDTSVWRLEDAT